MKNKLMQFNTPRLIYIKKSNKNADCRPEFMASKMTDPWVSPDARAAAIHGRSATVCCYEGRLV
jgi:hypothetical protein